MNIEETIRSYIEREFVVPAKHGPLNNDASLLNQGVLDSMAVFKVVGFLESEFGIQISDEEIVPENFESVNHISAYVRRKKGT